MASRQKILPKTEVVGNLESSSAQEHFTPAGVRPLSPASVQRF